MFVLKLKNDKYSCFGYITKGSMLVSTSDRFYDKSLLFTSVEDAESYIDVLLDSGRFRSDITRSDFSVVPVQRYHGCGLVYLTEAAYVRLV